MRIVTHSGHFHTDELLAVSTLLLKFPDAEIVRSRAQEVIDSADIVVDVGLIHDPEKMRFDHHQPGGAGERTNGIPFASFGLVWQKFGEELSGSLEAMKMVDEKLVMPVDAVDNGIDLYTTNYPGVREYALGDFFETYNYGVHTLQEFDERFFKALELAREFLNKEIRSARDTVEDWKKVREIYSQSENKKIIELPHNIHWKEVLINSDALYVVFPRPDGCWAVRAVPKDKDTYAMKKRLPISWSGLENETLQHLTQVPDALFCHRDGFIAVTKTREGAIELAKKALNA